MKRIAIVVIFFILAFEGYSQGHPTWRFGLKGAPSISWINPEIIEIDYDETGFGFSYGIIGERYFTETYAISSGFFVTHQGGKLHYKRVDIHMVNDNDDKSLEKRLYKFQFLDVPLTLKMRTREIGYFTYYGQFGVSFGFNIRARADDEYYDNSKATDVDISDYTHLFKASLIMGAGAEYSLLGNTAIVIGLYYNNGFSNVLDMGPYNGKKISGRANFVELTVGMFF